LAAEPEAKRGEGELLAVLMLAGDNGARWALPLAEVARVEELPPMVAVPSHGGALLGLAVIAGHRCMVVDLDALAAGVPPRSAARPGHAVLLRRTSMALAVDRAEEITQVPTPRRDPGEVGFALLADGTVLLDAHQLAAKANAQGGGG
jgi:chemotaxis signal transduction protein